MRALFIVLLFVGCIGKNYPTTVAILEENRTIWTGYHSPCGIKHYRYVLMGLAYESGTDSVTRTWHYKECDCEGTVMVSGAVDMMGMGFKDSDYEDEE